MAFKITVDTQQDKDDIIKASRYLHDLRNIDTNIPTINALCHLHLAPHLIIVDNTGQLAKPEEVYAPPLAPC